MNLLKSPAEITIRFKLIDYLGEFKNLTGGRGEHFAFSQPQMFQKAK